MSSRSEPIRAPVAEALRYLPLGDRPRPTPMEHDPEEALELLPSIREVWSQRTDDSGRMVLRVVGEMIAEYEAKRATSGND